MLLRCCPHHYAHMHIVVVWALGCLLEKQVRLPVFALEFRLAQQWLGSRSQPCAVMQLWDPHAVCSQAVRRWSGLREPLLGSGSPGNVCCAAIIVLTNRGRLLCQRRRQGYQATKALAAGAGKMPGAAGCMAPLQNSATRHASIFGVIANRCSRWLLLF